MPIHLVGHTRWRGQHVTDAPYQPYEQVLTQEGWLAIANQTTTDDPAPQRIGDTETLLPDVTPWASSQHNGTVLSGIDISSMTAERAYRIDACRIWIPDISAGVDYRLMVMDMVSGDLAVSTRFLGSDHSQAEWQVVPWPVWPYFTVGDHIRALCITQNRGTATSFNYVWEYDGTENSNKDPGSKKFFRHSQFSNLQISYWDFSDTNRATELRTVGVGDTIRVEESSSSGRWDEYEVTAVTDPGDYMRYSTVRTDSGNTVRSGRECTITFNTFTAGAVNYVHWDNYWSTWDGEAVIQGVLQLDDNPAVFNSHAYGVDLGVTELALSDDWDLQALTR